METGRLFRDSCGSGSGVGGMVSRGAERTARTPVVGHRDPLVLDHDRTRRCPRLALHCWAPGEVLADHPSLLSTHPQQLPDNTLEKEKKKNILPTPTTTSCQHLQQRPANTPTTSCQHPQQRPANTHNSALPTPTTRPPENPATTHNSVLPTPTTSSCQHPQQRPANTPTRKSCHNPQQRPANTHNSVLPIPTTTSCQHPQQRPANISTRMSCQLTHPQQYPFKTHNSLPTHLQRPANTPTTTSQ